MLKIDAVTQPAGSSTRTLIGQVLKAGNLNQIDIAAAYVTSGGARDLIETMDSSFPGQMRELKKRWLISFDYCRTEPVAVKMLSELPNSTVRVHDGINVVHRKCVPSRPFHPKTFLFKGVMRHAVLAGSGNVSRSGLNTGHEVGLLLDYFGQIPNVEHQALKKINAVQEWFDTAWRLADRFSSELFEAYKDEFNSVENLSFPIPTDDDPVEHNATKNSLTARERYECLGPRSALN
jgi:hypothetical protein